jgi:hypothetical protein
LAEGLARLKQKLTEGEIFEVGALGADKKMEAWSGAGFT